MEWEAKKRLAEALNDGDNKQACEIILNNEMDMQSWDIFVCGMDMTKCEDYRCLSDKIVAVRRDYVNHACISDVIRFGMLMSELGLKITE